MSNTGEIYNNPNDNDGSGDECNPSHPTRANTPSNGRKEHISPRKLAANQKNAQRSTGPRTGPGKIRSAQNSYKHGFFARKLFPSGEQASSEGREALEIGEQIRDYYGPVGCIEEMLVEKIMCESVRYARLLGHEQKEFARRYPFFAPGVDRLLRYQAAINRQLFQAIQQLEHLQSKRKADLIDADPEGLPESEDPQSS